MKGSVIQLANGIMKRVEDLTTLDFEQSASISPDLQLDSSIVESISLVAERDIVKLTFSVGEQRGQVTVESTVEHPFFVYDQGWSSFNPHRTLQLYRLSCHQLAVGDRCVSLTHKKQVVAPVSTAPTTGTNGPLSLISSNGSRLLSTVSASSRSARTDCKPRLASDSAALYYSTGKS